MFDQNRIAQIRGWLDVEEGVWLNQQAQKMDSIIEIGSWCGRSTYCLLEGCRGMVYAVDTFAGSPLEPTWQDYAREADVYGQFMSNVGNYPNLRVLKMRSDEAAQFLPVVDMVFIDGSHAYAYAASDLDLYTLKARVLLCGHDYTNPNWLGVRQAVQERFGPGELGVHHSIWYVRRASHVGN